MPFVPTLPPTQRKPPAPPRRPHPWPFMDKAPARTPPRPEHKPERKARPHA